MKKSEAKKLLKKEILSVLNEEYQLNEADAQTYDEIADTLRDLAKVPVKASKRISEMLNMPEITSEAAVSATEDNVLTLDKEEPTKVQDSKESFEQVLVDALMGRRKL